MKIFSLTALGKYHPQNCEDHVFHHYVGSQYLIAAVMDGCSSGVESHFASTMYGKSLHKSCRMLPNMKQILPELDVEQMDKEAVGNFILGQLFEDVKKVKKSLFLDIEELLSTILFLVYDLKNSSAWLNVSGDGLAVCNGVFQEFDQNNMPDYLAYHLDIKFDAWFNNHTKSYNFQDINDISISTDGLTKLKKNAHRLSREVDIIDRFLIQKPLDSDENALAKTFMNLTQEEHYLPYDDIGIIRLITDSDLSLNK